MEYVMKGDPGSGSLDIFHLILAPSYECNLSCRHCYNEEIKSSLSVKEWEEVINRWSDFLKKEEKKGIVHFKGGEPFFFDGLYELMEHSADQGCWVFVTTNGTLIGENEAKRLKKIYGRTKGKLILSLNGSQPRIDQLLREKGAYEKTVRTAELLKEKDIPFDINYVVHWGNQEDVGEAINLAETLGAVQFNLLPLMERGSAREEGIKKADRDVVLKQLEKAKKNGCELLEWSLLDLTDKLGSGDYRCTGCPAGYKGLAYAVPDGSVYPCPNTVIPGCRLGSVHDSFEELFESKQARRLRKNYQGKLLCKGELEHHKDETWKMKKLLASEERMQQSINQKLNEEKEKKTGKTFALCFNRNW